MQVQKRNGNIIDFKNQKIFDAIMKAFKATSINIEHTDLFLIIEQIKQNLSEKDIIHVEEIQDEVEKVLMKNYPEVAKAYILYRQKRAEIRRQNLELKPDPNAISDYIHAAKYAKYLPEIKRRETYNETVRRVVNMHKEKFPQLCNEIDEAFKYVYEKKVLPSMRSMQFAGEAIKQRNERMYNCSFTLIDRPKVFGEILYLLLCGVGVGYSVQNIHINKLPIISKINSNLVCFHTIKDTIEGWAETIKSLINAYINGYTIEFQYNELRPIGSKLKSGGKAPGHLALKNAIENCKNILNKVQNRKLTSLECHDIICYLSEAVLSGGIRRSSLLALFDYDDLEMFQCKNHFNLEGNFQRILANNSCVLQRDDPQLKEKLKDVLKESVSNFGEPGFIFLDNLNSGTNPCGEIGIDPILHTKLYPGGTNDPEKEQTGFGFCNLAEINVVNCKNENEFYNCCKAASFIATLQASYTNFPYLGKITEEICKRDALIGVSITGMMDAPWIFNKDILKIGAKYIAKTNIETAKLININFAKRCTCIKPSGTSSLLLGGISSGIHPQPYKKYFRNIIANKLEPIAQYFAKYNPYMVADKNEKEMILTFPMITNGVFIDQLTTKEFLEKIFLVWQSWILRGENIKEDIYHNVSCTIPINNDEINGEILEFLILNKNNYRSLTFIPKFISSSVKENIFLPRQEVKTKEEEERWNNLIKKYKPVDYTAIEENEDLTMREAACETELCQLSNKENNELNLNLGFRIFEYNDFLTKDIKKGDIFSIDNLTFKIIEKFPTYFIAQRV